jgi:hypothetical protein
MNVYGRWAILTAVAGSVTVHADRIAVPFDYGWQFKLGDPPDALPALTTASLDRSFTKNVSGMSCTQLAWSQLGRMGDNDCRGACSATPGCLVWQWAGHVPGSAWNATHSAYGCFIHDGTLGSDPTCTPNASSTYSGEARNTVAPLIQDRVGVTWAAKDFNDKSWDTVDVPHDFVLLGKYNNITADGHHGYLPRDEAGWYRKTFKLPTNWTDTLGATWIHFDGVFQAVDVFVNGKFVLRHTSGYLGFDVPLDAASELLKTGASDDNVISIRVDASFGSGHWYEGGGIQRRCYLMHASGPAFFNTDGLFAQTEKSAVTAEAASIVSRAEVSTANPSLTNVYVGVRWTLLGPDGSKAGDSSVTPSVHVDPDPKSGSSTELGGSPAIVVTNPKMWSVKKPTLYTLVAELLWTNSEEDNAVPDVPKVIDTIRTKIGLRAIDWTDENAGFKLNEEPLHIRGFSYGSFFPTEIYTRRCHWFPRLLA